MYPRRISEFELYFVDDVSENLLIKEDLVFWRNIACVEKRNMMRKTRSGCANPGFGDMFQEETTSGSHREIFSFARVPWIGEKDECIMFSFDDIILRR